MKRILIALFIMFSLISCLKNNINGIIISDTLLSNQSFQENKNLNKIINQCLNKEFNGFKKLLEYNCGEGTGCYNLGYILTQIIFRIGEDDYIKVISKLSKKDQINLNSFIKVGLEYGDNNYDEKMDNLRINDTFPKIVNFTNH